MNALLLKEIQTAGSKYGAYCGLLEYRYKNLCVKADPFSLLPVTVEANLYECNIEEVASVERTNDFQLTVYPHEAMYVAEISKGVLKAHPEFKQTLMLHPNEGDDRELNAVQLYDDTLEGSKYLVFTMPKVDKNRRDVLTNGVKTLYEECNSKIKVVNMQAKAELTSGSFLSTQKDMDEAEQRLKELYNTTQEKIDKLKQDKLDEIEEAYQHYLEEEGPEYDDNPGFDVAMGMRMGG